MTDDPRYSGWTLAAMVAWVFVAGLLVAAWMTWLLGETSYATLLLASTACAMSAVAATLQIRCFAARICRLIRLVCMSEEEGQRLDPENLRRI